MVRCGLKQHEPVLWAVCYAAVQAAASRGLPVDAMQAVAQGRVWAGSDALQVCMRACVHARP